MFEQTKWIPLRRLKGQIDFLPEQDSLKIEQASTLVGMLVNPYLYNPKRFPKNAITRRNIVLDRLEESGDS